MSEYVSVFVIGVLDMNSYFICLLYSNGKGVSKTVHSLLDSCLTKLSASLGHMFSPSQRNVFEDVVDNVLMYYSIVLREYTEYQLPSMAASSTLVLYQTCGMQLQWICARVGALAQVNTAASITPHISCDNDFLVVLLQILNHLSTRDFMLDDEHEALDNTSIRNFEGQVASVMMTGYSSIINIINPSLLAHFPHTCERYFSFVCFMINGYDRQMSEYLGLMVPAAFAAPDMISVLEQGVKQSSAHLSLLCEHSLWAVNNSPDAVVVRMSLNILSSANAQFYQHQSFQKNAMLSALPPDVQIQYQQFRYQHKAHITSIFFDCLCKLFDAVFLPTSSAGGNVTEGGLTWDKVDMVGGCMYSLLNLLEIMNEPAIAPSGQTQGIQR